MGTFPVNFHWNGAVSEHFSSQLHFTQKYSNTLLTLQMHFNRLLSSLLKHTFQGSTNCQIFYPKRLSLLDGAWTLDQWPVQCSAGLWPRHSWEGLLTRWFNEENVLRVADSPCWYWQSSHHKITQSVCCYLVYSRKLDSWAASHRISNCWLFLAGPWMRF